MSMGKESKLQKASYCPECETLMIISSKGNLYCPNICWKKPEVIERKRQERLDMQLTFDSEHDDWGDRD